LRLNKPNLRLDDRLNGTGGAVPVSSQTIVIGSDACAHNWSFIFV
jgi:hypothetical protein